MRRFALAFVLAGCSGDAGSSTSGDEISGPSTMTSATTATSVDSIATAWDSTDAASESSSGADGSTATSDETTGNTTTSDGESSSTTGPPPPPMNLLENPSLEAWAAAGEPNTTPDGWENCTGVGLAVDAVPDTCSGMPDAFDGQRYARGIAGEGIAQRIATVPGTTYRIAFQHTAVTECFGGGADARWEVLVDDEQVLATGSGDTPAWISAGVEFQAAGPSATICFRKLAAGEGGIDDLGVFEQLPQ